MSKTERAVMLRANMIAGRFFTVVLLCCVGAIACRQSVVETRTPEVPESSLEAVLVQSTDFSNDWTWISDKYQQTDEISATQNHKPVEGVGHFLEGRYGAKHDYFLVSNILYRYAPESPAINEVDYRFEEPGAKEFSLTFTLPGRTLMSECIQQTGKLTEDTAVRCVVAIRYSHFVLYFDIFTMATSDVQDLPQLFNPVLAKVDARIGEIDK
ncbi:MAG: hypothetical protein U0559_13665 [Anaerolineae bacterium]